MSNPTGKTGKRYVSYPEPGVTKVYYKNRVLVIKGSETDKEYGSKLRAVKKEGDGKYPSRVVNTRQAPQKPARAVKPKSGVSKTAPKKKKAVKTAKATKDDIWGKPPAPVFVREKVKAAPRTPMPIKAGYVAENPKGKKYRAQLILSGGRVMDVGTASSEERAHDMISDAYDMLSPEQRRSARWRIVKG